MAKRIKTYSEIEIENRSDIVAEPQYDLFFNNGENERHEEGTLRVLSLFFRLRWHGFGFRRRFYMS